MTFFEKFQKSKWIDLEDEKSDGPLFFFSGKVCVETFRKKLFGDRNSSRKYFFDRYLFFVTLLVGSGQRDLECSIRYPHNSLNPISTCWNNVHKRSKMIMWLWGRGWERVRMRSIVGFGMKRMTGIVEFRGVHSGFLGLCVSRV